MIQDERAVKVDFHTGSARHTLDLFDGVVRPPVLRINGSDGPVRLLGPGEVRLVRPICGCIFGGLHHFPRRRGFDRFSITLPFTTEVRQVDRADALLGSSWLCTGRTSITDGRVGHRSIDPRDGGRRRLPRHPRAADARRRPWEAGPSAGRAVRDRDAWVRGGIGHLSGPVQHDGNLLEWCQYMAPVGGVLLLRGGLFLCCRRAHHRGAGASEASCDPRESTTTTNKISRCVR